MSAWQRHQAYMAVIAALENDRTEEARESRERAQRKIEAARAEARRTLERQA